MSLIELKRYLKLNRIVSLASLMKCFNVDADFARSMLRHWQQKGCVVKSQRTSQCGVGCCKCDETITELYEWVQPHPIEQ